MDNFDLESFFMVKPKKPSPTPYKQSYLKLFFDNRNISDNRIAKYLTEYCENISAMQVGNWLNGRAPLPNKWRIELEKLKQMFLDWEKQHGRTFNE